MALISLTIFVAGIGNEVAAQGTYFVEIKIMERSGTNLTDFVIKLELNETNFNGWGKVGENGSDIYFMDENDNPLYYWIEYFNKTEKRAVILVKIPLIPANSVIRIFMYFGGTNPYPEYNNRSKVFIYYNDFESGSLDPGWTVSSGSSASIVTDGSYVLQFSTGGLGNFYMYRSISVPSYGWYLHAFVKPVSNGYDGKQRVYIGITDGTGTSKPISAKVDQYQRSDWRLIADTGYGTGVNVGAGTWYEIEIYVSNSSSSKTVKLFINGELKAQGGVPSYTPKYLMMWIAHKQSARFDDIIVLPYVEPYPLIEIGHATPVAGVKLPKETLYYVHSLVYRPNATQFSHSFSAGNTSTAGYETGVPDEYGWRVYALPYEVNGAYYENNATLISEIDIALPYTEVHVENLTLLARTNATGSLRQLQIKILDSSGATVVELSNASIGTDWTEVVLTVNTTLSGQITVWINATVVTTSSEGEEIAVKDVTLYVKHVANPAMIVEPSRTDYLDCSASYTVELGSADMLNRSVIELKLIEYVIFNSTDYPVEPVYIGNETIDGRIYAVYRIEPANYSQTMYIYAQIENVLRKFRTHAKGYDTDVVLVGEPLTIELPELGNVSIPELGLEYTNVTAVTVRVFEPMTITVRVNTTLPTLWKVGFNSKLVTVKYGRINARVLDEDGKEIDYENLRLQLVNATTGVVVKELVGNGILSFADLMAGNYTLVAYFKDIVVCEPRNFELNITIDNGTVDLVCKMKRLSADYRGFNRTIILEHDKQLVGVESLSAKYPYSRMRILLNGTGSFKLYINYRGDLPTKVSVAGNVTNLKYYWDGNYLVITGALGSVGEINVTDLYKLRVEIYDRLGNLMPSWVYAFINGTKYSGAIIEDYLYPEDYVVELPKTINGFEFYSFFDGYNETARAITINNSDVTLKAWYRVPTSVKEVKSYQVASLWWLPFIEQDSDRVKVYIEGYLLDYYGYGVPNRPITINITDVELGFTWAINVTTDAAGYFRTPLLELVRGRTYRIDVVYNGDDIYVGSYSTMEVKPEELPAAPAVPEIPIEYYIAAIAAVLIIVGIIAAALRAARHTVEDFRERSRRFVKRKG